MSIIETPFMRGLENVLDLSTFRHQLLAANLANVDTPGYRTRDLRTFGSELEQAMAGNEAGRVLTPVAREVRGLLQRPDGNNVSVERESLLIAQNQLHFQVAVQFLRKQFNQLSTAINGGGSTS